MKLFTSKTKEKIHSEVLRIRKNQIFIHNEFYKSTRKIPVHFAFGHEAIAAAVASVMQRTDKLLLTHRNLHYHLALGATAPEILREYLLSDTGLNNGKLGSMNLMNAKKNVIYTSNILGNNLSVATGVALANKKKKSGSATWCVTGDGAIEEGAFYENLLISVAQELPIIFMVENNSYSLATSIKERRKPLNLKVLAKAVGCKYLYLHSNNAFDYLLKLRIAIKQNINKPTPLIVESKIETLGSYEVTNPVRRVVNYHSGKLSIELNNGVILKQNIDDPAWVSAKKLKSL
jgi:TPP-dependent pyruvate/acetoin dehydrogenase alpha subunit